MLRRLTLFRATVAGLLVLLAVVVVGNSCGTPVTDIKPEVYLAPGEMLGRYLSAWTSSPYLGFPNFNVGVTPVLAVLAPGAAVGLPPEALFKAFHLALWVLAAVGAAHALRALVPATGRWGGLAAAVFYVANPYAVVGGSTLAVLLPYAVLPWLVVTLVRALHEPRSWRWPAAFGLAFFAMSGMNVAIVPVFQLIVVPPVLLVVGRSLGLEWAAISKVVARCALVVVGVSLYWLLPAVAAAGTGLQVAAESESVAGIARVSSLVEVLRGMGIWSIYGSGPDGPWVPEFAPYLANPVVIVLTLAWPVLALLALGGAPPVLRRVAGSSIGLTAVVLVGFFPGTVSTPLAWAVQWAFDLVPTLVAFRTTNKAGAVLALSFALLLGHAVPRWFRAVLRWRAVPVIAGVAALTTVCAWVLPALTGNLYTSPVAVPSYWREAAHAVDRQSHSSRVLFLPSQVRASYRWTDERPDDISNSLMTRGAIIPETSPNASPPGANFLAALGDLLASGAAGPDTVSTMARYLGAGDVLLRHDTRWEGAAGVRPQASASLLAADPGLLGLGNFGRPGQNVVGPAGPTGLESILPPLQHYGVQEAVRTVSARPTSDGLTVAGDAWAFDGLARSGRLPGAPVVWYATDTTPEDLAGRLGTGHRLVLTDTNRRQSAIPNRLTAGYGPLLPDTADPEPTRALGNPGSQTVLRRTGPTVTASQVGSAFFDTPYGQPDNVLDGDPSTSWLFGDFERAPGATLDVRWPAAQQLGVVTVRPTALGSVHLDTVTLEAGGVTRTVTLPDRGEAKVDFGGVSADHLTLRVGGIRGSGFSLVGIAELGLPGPAVVRVARTPESFDILYAGLDADGRRAFARTPFDVSLTRVANGLGNSDDTESALLRDFTLPTSRTFAATARVVMSNRSPRAFDQLSGRLSGAAATASSTYFDNPDLRASMASDGDPGTAWVPGGDPVGAWWQVEGPRRALDSVLLEQRPSTFAAPSRTVTRVAVEIDGRRVVEAAVRPGRTEVALPQGTEGRAVRIVLLAVVGPADGLPPQLTTVGTGATTPSAARPACRPVALLDGRPLSMRPVSIAAVAAVSDRGVAWEGCAPVALAAGEHSLRPLSGFVVDALDLADEEGPAGAPRPVTDLVTAVGGRDVDQTIDLAATDVPVALKTGQSWDPRWHATVDGVDLGPPRVVDGWSIGWVLDAGGERTVHVTFGPQRAADAGLWASAVVVLVAAGAWLLPRKGGEAPLRPAGPHHNNHRPSRRWTERARVLTVLAVVAAGVGFGLPGLVGCALLVVMRQLRVGRRDRSLAFGAGLVAAGGLIQVWASHGSWGRVDAGVPATTLWPHWVAVVGLVLVLGATLRQGPVAPVVPIPPEGGPE